MFLLTFISVIMFDIFEWKQICAGFFITSYICIAIGNPIIKRERVGIPRTGFTLPHFCIKLHNKLYLHQRLHSDLRRDRMLVGFTTTYAINAYRH